MPKIFISFTSNSITWNIFKPSLNGAEITNGINLCYKLLQQMSYFFKMWKNFITLSSEFMHRYRHNDRLELYVKFMFAHGDCIHMTRVPSSFKEGRMWLQLTWQQKLTEDTRGTGISPQQQQQSFNNWGRYDRCSLVLHHLCHIWAKNFSYAKCIHTMTTILWVFFVSLC